MKQIELEKREYGWYVRSGELWCEELTGGEALEVVASIILTGRAPYLRNDLQHFLWNSRYGIGPKLLTESVQR